MTKEEDVLCLLGRLEVMSDVINYNSTLVMGDEYQNWVSKHKELVSELYYMLKKDLEWI